VSYYKKLTADSKAFAPLTKESVCFECGKEISGAGVGYDGYADDGFIRSLYFHSSCAAIVGQRLIFDGYPNRRDK
jgi:hypothetical protein